MGPAQGGNSQAGDMGNRGRKGRLLDLPGQLHFVLEPLPLGMFLDQLLELSGHLVKGFGQITQLIPRVKADLVAKITPGYGQSALPQVTQGLVKQRHGDQSENSNGKETPNQENEQNPAQGILLQQVTGLLINQSLYQADHFGLPGPVCGYNGRDKAVVRAKFIRIFHRMALPVSIGGQMGRGGGLKYPPG